jgi:hypothetical protein
MKRESDRRAQLVAEEGVQRDRREQCEKESAISVGCARRESVEVEEPQEEAVRRAPGNW